jgi:hypothetical protein
MKASAITLTVFERSVAMAHDPDLTTESEIIDNPLPSRDERIRQRAYELYEARGQQEGHDLEDWLQAKAEIEAGETPDEETGIPAGAL